MIHGPSTSKRPAILVASSSATFRGGSDGALYDYLRLHSADDQNLTVRFFESGPAVSDSRWKELDCEAIDVGRIRQLHRWYRSVKNLRKLIRGFEPDIALGWTAKEHLYLGPASRHTKTKSVWFQMGLPNSGIVDRIVRTIHADAIIACSNFVATAQRLATPSVPVYPVALGADLSRFDPQELPTPRQAKEQLGLPTDRPVIGIVGRLQRWKGFDTVVRAMPSILEGHPETQCVLVGGRHDMEKEYESELHSLIADSGCASNIQAVGFQSNVPLWMQAMDVVIHASEKEPFGIVVVEAMALAKAVVAAVPGGPSEIIQDGENGFLIESGNDAQLADRVCTLLGDTTLRLRLGERAKERAVTLYSSRAYVKRLSDCLKSIVHADEK